MKKVLFILFILSFVSCSNYQKLLKSDNFDMKFETALSYFNESKYSRALVLFEDILSEFKEVTGLRTFTIIIRILFFI